MFRVQPARDELYEQGPWLGGARGASSQSTASTVIFNRLVQIKFDVSFLAPTSYD